ncbi:MAG: DUF4357 domain-containing protein [Synergistaceae bacterium]|jgi:hypothetical protein|nr:DUF4357 domain-containing protein [Synergistaceae bacterium]
MSAAKTVREENKDNIDVNGILLRDILFKTPSGASSFVLGAPTNGNIEWRTDDGKVLKDIENREIISENPHPTEKPENEFGNAL